MTCDVWQAQLEICGNLGTSFPGNSWSSREIRGKEKKGKIKEKKKEGGKEEKEGKRKKRRNTDEKEKTTQVLAAKFPAIM